MKFMNEIDFKWFRNEKFFDRDLLNTLSPMEINPIDNVAIYYIGTHRVLWDFPENRELKKIAERIYENNGYITVVCHGVVGVLNLEYNNEILIQGKKITRFTNMKELISRKNSEVPFSIEDELKKKGAVYSKKRFFKSYAICDNRIITGQNP